MSQTNLPRRRPSSADIRRRNLLVAARERGNFAATVFKDWMLQRAGREATYLHREMWDEYRKGMAAVIPAKMVYTISDLRELQDGTVLRTSDGGVADLHDGAWHGFHFSGSSFEGTTSKEMSAFLPAVVLWEPGAPNDPECKDGGL